MNCYLHLYLLTEKYADTLLSAFLACGFSVEKCYDKLIVGANNPNAASVMLAINLGKKEIYNLDVFNDKINEVLEKNKIKHYGYNLFGGGYICCRSSNIFFQKSSPKEIKDKIVIDISRPIEGE